MKRIEITRSDGSLRILRTAACAYASYEEMLPAVEGGEETRCIVHTIRVTSDQAWLHRAVANGGPVEFRMTTKDLDLELFDLLVTEGDTGEFVLEGREAL